MAFLDSSDSIVIRATLTEKGKKLLARGKFKIAKFSLSDDEIDYELFNANRRNNAGYVPALKKTKAMEAYKDTNKSLHFGLNSYDSGVLYLSEDELSDIESTVPHAFVEFLPVLLTNNKLSYSPTLRQDRYYLSINDETTKIINDGIPSLKFLQTNDFDIRKIVIESGLINKFASSIDKLIPTIDNRENLIVKKFLLDRDFFVYADNRFISTIVGIQETSRFENFSSGEKIINFNTGVEASAISLENEFDYYATYVLRGVSNLLFNYGTTIDDEISTKYSAFNGPRGSVVALNIKVDNELKINSTGIRDSRFTQFGRTGQFLEMPGLQFDYIDTTIYIIGATSNARLQIPLRILRYAGT